MDGSGQIDQQTLAQRGTELQLSGTTSPAIDQNDERHVAAAFLQLASRFVCKFATVAIAQHHERAGWQLGANFVDVVRHSIWNAIEHERFATSPRCLHTVYRSI